MPGPRKVRTHMPTFYDLIRDREDASRREDLAKATAEKATEEHDKRLVEREAADKRLADALHLLGKPVEWGGQLYRLDGLGGRMRLVVTDVLPAYNTAVPDPPADLAPPAGVGDEGLHDTFPSVALDALDHALSREPQQVS
jgi:hypothetical protein